MRPRVALFTAAILYLACQPAAAQAVDHSQPFPKSTLAVVRKAAEQGDANAQFKLGFDYANGEGVPHDYTQAALWWRKAAEQGNGGAQYNLGWLYEYGHGVPQDYSEAVVWYRKSAEQGLADAQNKLGVMNYVGRGVSQDYTQAVNWWRKAAEQGFAVAQYNLGGMYQVGHGVPQDYSEAYFWYDVAAAGKLDRQEDAAKRRDELASHLTAEELTLVQDRAKKWFETHPSQP
jgi:TPR repeat protein